MIDNPSNAGGYRLADRPRTSLAGQAIAVVGSASGIGRTAAFHLAGAGATVACLDRAGEAAAVVASDITDRGGAAHDGELDVRHPETVRAALASVERAIGPLHALVNCVGITGTTNVDSHMVDLADFDTVCQVNLRGAFVLSQAVLPGMVERGYGRILHVASIAGKEGNPGMVAYSASKAGLIGMVKSQGKEYAQTGVTVNALAPAVIRTPLVDVMPDAQVDYMTSRIPMGRLGALDEAGELITWIVSPACSFTTGFTFDLSGGRAVY